MFTPDNALPGLYIKQLASGSKWVVRARQRGTPNMVTVTIGRTDVFGPAEARAAAKQALAALSRGENPNQTEKVAAEDQKRLKITLREALDEFLDAKRLKHKPATTYSYRTVMGRSFADWMNRPLGSITRDEVVKRLGTIQEKVAKTTKWTEQANKAGVPEALKAMRYLNAVMNFYAIDEYGGKLVLPKGNPVRIFKHKDTRPTLKRRERFLTERQRDDLLDELSHSKHSEYRGKISSEGADYLFLLLLTGMRKNEARTLRWDCVDFEAGFLKVTETKNSRPLILPLTDAVRSTLERRAENRRSPYVFPDRTGSKPAAFKYVVGHACAEVGFKFTLHDLRRTVATVASEQGYSLDQIGALLNHANDTVTDGYVARTLETVTPIMQSIEMALLKHYAVDPNPPEPTEADDLALGLPVKTEHSSSNVLPFRAGHQRKQQG